MKELRRVQNSEEVGLSSSKLEGAFEIIRKSVDSGKMMGASIQIARKGVSLEPRAYGKRKPANDLPVQPDTIFLTASVTKPVTCTAAMVLVERGEVGLDDPVQSIVPEFAGGLREKVLVRHLLTHTSGLPDQLPENGKLRSQHAPMDEFIRRTYATPILFEPGTSISYSSSGMTMLMDMVQRMTGQPLREFMKQQIFDLWGWMTPRSGSTWPSRGGSVRRGCRRGGTSTRSPLSGGP